MDMYQKREQRKKNKEIKNNEEKSFAKVSINWYPGHMAKTKRLVREHLEFIDIVLELVDARIPLSSKNHEIDSLIKNKPRILIMTKYDLCDQNETKKWINFYEKKGYMVVPMDLEKGNVASLVKKIEEVSKPIHEARIKKGMKKRKVKALILGIPNVGKSTLINRLVGKKVANVGNKPGVTKSLDWIRINDSIELMDTPGILWPRLDNERVAFNLASLNAIKEEILPLDDVAIYILKELEKLYPEILKDRYGMSKIDEDIILTLDEIGKKRGALQRGGLIDYEKVVKIIINDVKTGIIKKITFDRLGENNVY